MNALGELSFYRREVYRVFSTVQPSQDLVDDLCSSPEEAAELRALYYGTFPPPSQLPFERAFHHSVNAYLTEQIAAKFDPEKWHVSRYSDGSWFVLYAAEAEKTAFREALHHKRNFYREELERKELSIDLRLVELHLSTESSIDLTQSSSLDFALATSSDESGYPYCQELARKGIERGAHLFRAPSARHGGGICVPIFDAGNAALRDKGHLKYFKVILNAAREKTKIFREDSQLSRDEMS